MGQTLIVLAVLAAIWLAFGLLTTTVRRRKLQGEHPGVGERTTQPIQRNERTRQQSWHEGRRPWH